MQVSSINSSVKFGNLFIDEDIKNKIKSNASSEYKQQFSIVNDVIKSQKCDRLKYVDVLLEEYPQFDGYFRTAISSKKEGLPYNPAIYFYFNAESLDNIKKLKKDFSSYARGWNYDYSPKAKREYTELMNIMAEELIKNNKKYAASQRKKVSKTLVTGQISDDEIKGNSDALKKIRKILEKENMQEQQAIINQLNEKMNNND